MALAMGRRSVFAPRIASVVSQQKTAAMPTIWTNHSATNREWKKERRKSFEICQGNIKFNTLPQ
jgi:hypothetical protein